MNGKKAKPVEFGRSIFTYDISTRKKTQTGGMKEGTDTKSREQMEREGGDNRLGSSSSGFQ